MAKTKREKIEAKRRRSGKRAMQDGWAASAPVRPAEDDPRGVVLDARRRHMCRPTRECVTADLWGDPSGQAIVIGAVDADEARRLWSVFKAADAADDVYTRLHTGIRRFPNVARMEYLPETFETRPDDRPDARTPDERDRAAVNDWMRWQGHFGCIDRAQHTVIVDAMRHRARLVHAGKLTATGAAFVVAMRALDRATQR